MSISSRLSASDIVAGSQAYRIWYLIGSGDMRRRYSRSRLGQIWIMLSSAVQFTTIGIVFTLLFGLPAERMLPHVVFGLAMFQFFSSTILDCAGALPANAHFFLNQYVPTSTAVFAVWYRNLLTFGLNLVFPVIVWWGYCGGPKASFPLGLIGCALLALLCLTCGLIVAIICVRFRDLVQLISNMLQVLMYLSPIMWRDDSLAVELRPYFEANPLAWFIDAARAPMLGEPVSGSTWIGCLTVLVLSTVAAFVLLERYGRRVIYWL